MNLLERHIRDVIVNQGPLSVAAYMDLALQHPLYGYYRRHDPLGREGDFITAPEISQMFGEMIGIWAADVWRTLGKPEKFTLLELGPGRGNLMSDLLRATAKVHGFQDAMDLCFIESNETFRRLHQEKLSAYNVRYLDGVGELIPQPTIVIANEFFDALPVHQFEMTFQGWRERMIDVVDGKLQFILAPTDMGAALASKHIDHAKPGVVFEFSPASLGIIRQLSKYFMNHKGAALVIDYGFVESSGQSTFQAISEHSYADVLQNPGDADLTAHVDFGTFKKVSQEVGAQVWGAIGQGDLLKNLGIEVRAAQLKKHATPLQSTDIESAFHRLTDDDHMGVLFKALAITSPHFSSLAGF